MSEHWLLDGPSSVIEVLVDPLEGARGLALITHPHPLFGGTADNKVVTTLARALRGLGYTTLRPNFRGVGQSSGTHDHGVAETLDMLAVHDAAQRRYGPLPVVLAGFSFGAHVATRVARQLAERTTPIERLVLVGTAGGNVEGARSYLPETVAPGTLVIHGSADTTVSLANVVAWAEPQELPIIVIPGADHFFHRKLHLIRNILHDAWSR